MSNMIQTLENNEQVLKSSHSNEPMVLESQRSWSRRECRRVMWKHLSQQKKSFTQELASLIETSKERYSGTVHPLTVSFSWKVLHLPSENLTGTHLLVRVMYGERELLRNLCTNKESIRDSAQLRERTTLCRGSEEKWYRQCLEKCLGISSLTIDLTVTYS